MSTNSRHCKKCFKQLGKGEIYMNICIIGSGNVATHIAKALLQVGHNIVAVYSRQIQHARNLSLQVQAPLATDDLMTLPTAHLYLFAVKDNVLHEVAQKLAHNPLATQSIWVHTAGSLPLSTLLPHQKIAVLYPLMTFSKEANIDFKTLPLFIEGNNKKALAQISQLAHELSNQVILLSSDKRKYLHLAAVFANNFANHCFTLAFELLKKQDIPPTCLLPIIDETSRKLHCMLPQQAQTGPAKRWDTNVMNEQLNELADNTELQKIYQFMSKSIHRHQ